MLCAEDRKGKGFFSSEPGSQCGMIHSDHLAPVKMTDSTGQVVWAADYKPFGEATVTVSTITNNLRFPGQYFDAETGLHQNGFRDYSPPRGGYIEADPVGIGYGFNHLYNYVGQKPTKATDPYGLSECIWAGFSGNFVVGYGMQVIKQAGKCKDGCGKWKTKHRNCICDCVGLSAGGCGGAEKGDDSTVNEGWGAGYSWVCVGNSGGGVGAGWKYGFAYCWCVCSIVD
jgi:RHS repeat-associated protein